MARVSHLLRRGASYYARIRVPLDLIEVMGKRELVKALATSEEAEAKRRLWPQITQWQAEFDELRSRRALDRVKRRKQNPEDLEKAAKRMRDNYAEDIGRAPRGYVRGKTAEEKREDAKRRKQKSRAAKRGTLPVVGLVTATLPPADLSRAAEHMAELEQVVAALEAGHE